MFTRWIGWDSRDLDGYKQLVKAAREMGFAGVGCGGLSEMTASQRPDLDDPYTLYIAPHASIFKFVEAGVIKGVYEPEHIAKNAALLRAKSKILAKHKMSATFTCTEPEFLPESFFDKHPRLRGPRIDHPGRSRCAYYAPCMDREEILDAYRDGVRALVEMCPQIKRLVFLLNDSGSGACWSQNLYAGQNGPDWCKDIPFGERVGRFCRAMLEGAEAARAKDFSVFLNPHSSFTVSEITSTAEALPARAGFSVDTPGLRWAVRNVFGRVPRKEGKPIIPLASGFAAGGDFGPVGMPLPFLFLEMLAAMDRAGLETVALGASRGKDLPNIYTEIFRKLKRSVPETEFDQLRFLSRVLADIGVKDKARLCILAWREIDSAARFWPRQWLLNYYGVHTHLIWELRPLVPLPERLSDEEQAPYRDAIFCAGTDAERRDLFWEAGNRIISDWRSAALYHEHFALAINHATRAIEILEDALKGTKGREKQFLSGQLDRARYMRIFFRTENNVIAAQTLIDKYTTQYKEEYHVDKARDLGRFKSVMKDEMDNTREWIELASARPEFFGDAAVVDKFQQKISSMERHLPDCDDLFAGWRETGTERDFADGVKRVGW